MNHEQFIQILRGRWGIVVSTIALIVAATVLVSLIMPKKYAASTTLMIDFKNAPTETLSNAQFAPDYMKTQLMILKSQAVALKVVDKLKLASSPAAQRAFQEQTGGKGNIQAWLAESLLKRLEIDPAWDTRLITIRYEASNPEFAAAVADAFAGAYLDVSIELTASQGTKNADWFEKQLNTLRDRVETAQKNLIAYQQRQRLSSIDERLDIETAKLTALAERSVAARAESADMQARLQQYENVITQKGDLDTLSELAGNPYIQTLKSGVVNKRDLVRQLGARLGDKHPQYQQAQAELKGLEGELSRELQVAGERIVQNAEQAAGREKSLQEQLEQQKQKILDMKQAQERLPVLLREAEGAQQSYNAALQKFNEAKLQGQATQTNIMILSPAVAPYEPSSPKMLLNVIVALVLGSFMGIALALFFEMRSPKLRLNTDLEDSIGLPLLGALVKA